MIAFNWSYSIWWSPFSIGVAYRLHGTYFDKRSFLFQLSTKSGKVFITCQHRIMLALGQPYFTKTLTMCSTTCLGKILTYVVCRKSFAIISVHIIYFDHDGTRMDSFPNSIHFYKVFGLDLILYTWMPQNINRNFFVRFLRL